MNLTEKRFSPSGAENMPFFCPCKKFQRKFSNEVNLDTNRALVFLNLRQHQCPKSQASKFSQKIFCRYDTSLKYDGPHEYRQLKPYTYNASVKHINGWTNVGPSMKFEMGSYYQSQPACLIENNDDENLMKSLNHKLEKIFDDNQNLEVSKSTESLENAKFSLKTQSREKLLERLKEFKTKKDDEVLTRLKYIKLEKQFCFNSIKEHEKEKQYHEENSDSILENLNIFKPSIDIDLNKFKVKEKFSYQIYEKIRKKFLKQKAAHLPLKTESINSSIIFPKEQDLEDKIRSLRQSVQNQIREEQNQFNNQTYIWKSIEEKKKGLKLKEFTQEDVFNKDKKYFVIQQFIQKNIEEKSGSTRSYYSNLQNMKEKYSMFKKKENLKISKSARSLPKTNCSTSNSIAHHQFFSPRRIKEVSVFTKAETERTFLKKE